MLSVPLNDTTVSSFLLLTNAYTSCLGDVATKYPLSINTNLEQYDYAANSTSLFESYWLYYDSVCKKPANTLLINNDALKIFIILNNVFNRSNYSKKKQYVFNRQCNRVIIVLQIPVLDHFRVRLLYFQ